MISSHPTCPDTAEGLVFLYQMHETIVDCHTTGHSLLQNSVAPCSVPAEPVQRQRTIALVDKGDGGVKIFILNDGQNWPENFLAHHRQIRIDTLHQGWREFVPASN